jgi:hypothetical protein
MQRSRIQLISVFLAVVFFVCCSGKTQKQPDLVSYLDDLGKRYEEICVEMGIANWNLYSKEGEADQDTPKKKYARLLLDPARLEMVERGLEKIDRTADPMLFRKLQVWKDVLTAAKVDMDEDIFKLENLLESEITNYKHDVAGELVPHKQLQRALDAAIEDPSERDKKYNDYMTEMQMSLEPRVLELMKRRNTKSQEVGFDDYGQLCLYMMGLLPEGSDWFYDVLTLIDRKTLEPYKVLLEQAKKRFEKDKIRLDDLMRFMPGLRESLPGVQVVPVTDPMDRTREILMNIGFDLDGMPIRIVEENIPYGGLGLAIKVPTDHRIVVQKGRGSVDLFLHEIGHGIQAVYITSPDPIFHNYEWCLGAYSPAFDEGLADIIAGFARADGWQKKYNKKSEERLSAEKRNQDVMAPYSIRSQIAGFLFEIELYKNLDENPENVRRELQKKWLMIEPDPDSRQNWATSVFPVAYPIYDQNYFLASIIDWQVHDYLKGKFGEDYVFNTDVSTWIKQNLCAMGHGIHWMDIIERATGRPLDIEGWLASQGME